MRKIVRIEFKDESVVKGRRLEGVRKLGSVDQMMAYYKSLEIEEYIFHNVVASLYNKKIDLKFMKKVTNKLFHPVSMSGGIKSFHTAEQLITNGAEKVIVNSVLSESFEIISDVERVFGSQAIAIQVEARMSSNGEVTLYYNSGRERHKCVSDCFVREVQDRGAGEIVIISIDKDGMNSGPDMSLIEWILDRTFIPCVYGGGIKNDSELAMIEREFPELSGVCCATKYMKQAGFL